MNVLQETQKWLNHEDAGKIIRHHSVAGGSTCQSQHIETSKGRSYFVKSLDHPLNRLFYAEAFGLQAITNSGAIKTPEVFVQTDDMLILEYLAPSKTTHAYWKNFGRQLAAMHLQPVPNFGFEIDNFCGLSPQPNNITLNGHEFFAQYRLIYQSRLALDNKLLSSQDHDRVIRLCNRLPEFIPQQKPALVHGDLWQGNFSCTNSDTPVIFDPACHRGWAESDIAMTQLFGTLPNLFYQSYLEVNPLETNWHDRIMLYNLYHLLNHLNLFGRSYYPQVIKVTQRYV